MTTVLKSRRTGEDLRNHPAVQRIEPGVSGKPLKSNQRALEGNRVLTIEKYKSGPYDRGSYKVLINGRQWGWVKTEWHGAHGTSYHLEDMHGRCGHYEPPLIPGKGSQRFVEVQANGPRTRHQKIDNIFKERTGTQTPIRTSTDIILDMIVKALGDGYFRDPDTRKAEREAAVREHQESHARHLADQEKQLQDKAAEVLQAMPGYSSGPESPLYQQDVEILIAAMRWAQLK